MECTARGMGRRDFEYRKPTDDVNGDLKRSTCLVESKGAVRVRLERPQKKEFLSRNQEIDVVHIQNGIPLSGGTLMPTTHCSAPFDDP
jgi:hypothetical protein